MTIFSARRTWSVGLLALAVCMFNAQAPRAANISIHDALGDETITFSWAGFVDFSVNGVEVEGDGSVNVPKGVPLLFAGDWNWFQQDDTSFAGSVNFLEPDGATLSAIFQYEASVPVFSFFALISGSFESDDHQGAPLQPVQGGLTIIEDGTPQELSGLLAFPEGLSIQVQSDVEAQVPEPASILLLGTGLVAAARFRRAHGKR